MGSNRKALSSPQMGQRDYNRLKYYSALKTHQTRESGFADSDFLSVPEHLIPAEYFIIDFGIKDADGKHGSFTTIFSSWNAMAGTGIVTMPWAFQQSGIVLGLILTFIAFLISFYTCYLVIKTAGNDIDYTDTLRRHFGPKGWAVGMICFCINLYVPILIFFQLLAQNLFPILLVIVELFTGNNREIDLKPDWGNFSYTWCCVIIYVLVFGMTAIRDLQIFVRINSYGVIFITLVILFICGMGFYAFGNTSYTTNQTTFDTYLTESEVDPSIPYLAFVALFGKQFAKLMGILGGGFYFHNISLPVIRGNRNPENNVRDIFIGYFLVFVTYCLAGVLGYYGFLGSVFAD